MPKTTSGSQSSMCGMLTGPLVEFFSKRIRARGESYFYGRHVTALEFDGNAVFEALVQGSDRYSVTIEIKHDKRSWALQADCSCPYSLSFGGFCKHVWATLLAIEESKADELASLGPMPERMTLSFMDDEYDEPDEDDTAWNGLDLDLDDGSPVYRFLRESQPPRATTGRRRSRTTGRREDTPAWKTLLQRWPSRSRILGAPRLNDTSPVEPLYILDVEESTYADGMVISLAQQKRTASGALGKIKRLQLSPADVPRIPDERDRRICLLLMGAGSLDGGSQYRYYSDEGESRTSKWKIPPALQAALLPLLAASDRFFVREHQNAEPQKTSWEEGDRWEPQITFTRQQRSQPFCLVAQLRRGDETRAIQANDALIDGDPALVIRDGLISQVAAPDGVAWLRELSTANPIAIKKSDLSQFLDNLARLDTIPPIEWPADWRVETVSDCSPQPQLSLEIDESKDSSRQAKATAELTYFYQDVPTDAMSSARFVIDPKRRLIVHRQREVENGFLGRLHELGARQDYYREGFEVPLRRLPDLISTLLEEQWTVLANRKPYRRPGEFKIDVTSDIDWFDVNGQVDFDGQHATIPELLAAWHKKEKFVRLGDGSFGLLPQEWLAQHRALLELGNAEDGSIRFAKTQIGVIDALLSELPDSSFDAQVAAARKKLAQFSGIKPRNEPRGFKGELRPYQRDGLGWLRFLEELGWGGCLADDMGLGKTVQILGLLADRRRQRKHGPSLIVAPKSVIFNWEREAARFSPKLRVLNYTGSSRAEHRGEIPDSDLVVTTYGTLRQDIEFLSSSQFNYAILDEAQAIKNPGSQSAKAARCLRARCRVALTGTPVENHLGDLWSILEFLNPGMLGTAKVFKEFIGHSPTNDGDTRQLGMLQRIVRPFVLRRTKTQVAPELPQRNEQTIQCELGPKQLRYYRELRDYYRASLLKRVDDVGLARCKMHVLEALLRLRQAACHPGLIDPSKEKAGSTKLDTLLAMIGEIIDEGHKALIYSQFTTMLSFVRAALDKRNLVYEYLDGRTRDRAGKVDRFQGDPKCPLFLISLKAGGVGLNLTSAEYVFILDPWWNPAVEAQAIDRAHRIGQKKSVMAYRLIARDTVEEKIVELQQSKRELADAIITEQNSLIRTLTREDISLLLS